MEIVPRWSAGDDDAHLGCQAPRRLFLKPSREPTTLEASAPMLGNFADLRS